MSLVNTLRTMPRYRLTVLAVFLVAACGVCGSFFGQYVLKMNPCVMCIQQRLALVATMLLALVCIALPHRKLLGRTLAAVLISAPAAFGAWVAAKQIHLQSLPPAEQPDCGAPLVWSVMFFSAVLLIVWAMWLRTCKHSWMMRQP